MRPFLPAFLLTFLIVVFVPADAAEDVSAQKVAIESSFSAVFGQPEPADLKMLHAGTEGQTQIVFTLDRPWQKAAATLQGALDANGYVTYALPGMSDTLVFATGVDRSVLLFVQHNSTSGNTRVVANIQE